MMGAGGTSLWSISAYLVRPPRLFAQPVQQSQDLGPVEALDAWLICTALMLWAFSTPILPYVSRTRATIRHSFA